MRAVLKAALFSGGKDSTYAALLEWPVDLFVTFVYEFPRPSPHLLNMAKLVELANAVGVPLVVQRVHKGRELEEEAALLRRLGVSTVVAGDQAVEEHLKYMERLAAEAGARLREPLWGLDPAEVLAKELEEVEFLVIGAGRSASEIVCERVDRRSGPRFLERLRALGVDPIGERGEYHSLVVEIKRLPAAIGYRCAGVKAYGDYLIAEVL